jgi:hypothetical protein
MTMRPPLSSRVSVPPKAGSTTQSSHADVPSIIVDLTEPTPREPLASRPSSRGSLEETLLLRLPEVSRNNTSSMKSALLSAVLVALVSGTFWGVSSASPQQRPVEAAAGPEPPVGPGANDTTATTSDALQPTAFLVPPAHKSAAERPVADPNASRDQVAVQQARVRLSDVDVVWGRTSMRKIHTALNRSLSKMQRCVESTKWEGSTPIALSLRVHRDGRLHWIHGLREEHISLQSCIGDALEDTSFPLSKAGLRLDLTLAIENQQRVTSASARAATSPSTPHHVQASE